MVCFYITQTPQTSVCCLITAIRNLPKHMGYSGVCVSVCVRGEWQIRLTRPCHPLTTIRKLLWQTVRLKATKRHTHTQTHTAAHKHMLLFPDSHTYSRCTWTNTHIHSDTWPSLPAPLPWQLFPQQSALRWSPPPHTHTHTHTISPSLCGYRHNMLITTEVKSTHTVIQRVVSLQTHYLSTIIWNVSRSCVDLKVNFK